MRRQQTSHPPVTRDHVEDPRRQTGFRANFREQQCWRMTMVREDQLSAGVKRYKASYLEDILSPDKRV